MSLQSLPKTVNLEISKGEFNCHCRLMSLGLGKLYCLQILNSLYTHLASSFIHTGYQFFFLKYKDVHTLPSLQKRSVEHLAFLSLPMDGDCFWALMLRLFMPFSTSHAALYYVIFESLNVML